MSKVFILSLLHKPLYKTVALLFSLHFIDSAGARSSSKFSILGTFTWTYPLVVPSFNAKVYGTSFGTGMDLLVDMGMLMEVSNNVYLTSNLN